MDQPNISGAVPPDTAEDTADLKPVEMPDDVRASLDSGAALMEADEEVWEPPEIPKEPVTLKTGGQVLFRDPGEFCAKDVKPAMRGLNFGGVADFVDGIAPVAIKTWDLKDRNGKPIKPPSINDEAMGEITPMAWNELARWLALYLEHFNPPEVRSRPTSA